MYPMNSINVPGIPLWMKVPQGVFALERYPIRRNERLQAWDAADEFLLKHIGDVGGNVLIVNDSAGALSTALAVHHPSMLSDSYLAHAATRENLLRNAIDISAVRLIRSFDPLPALIDIVLMKVPKSLALLEDQLHRIAPAIQTSTVFVAAAMAKHIHTSTLELFENIVGPTRTSLAEKKARLVFCTPDPVRQRPPNPWPKKYAIASSGYVVTSHAGVFSSTHLDAGTGFLLEHLPHRAGPLRVVDLGCGNGVLGMWFAINNPEADVTFIDESYRAVASAEATFRANLGPERAARFAVGNNMFDLDGAPLSKGSVDLVLNNPPFHDNHAIGDATAWEMFSESREALRPNGELWAVGNRHLAYHAKLKRLFGNCEVVASNAGFVVLRAVKSRS